MRRIMILALALLLIPSISFANSLDELLAEKGVVARGASGDSSPSGGRLWYDEGTQFSFPDAGFSMKVATVIRTRWTYDDDDDKADQSSRFSLPDARLKISGTAVNEEFSYLLQTDFTDSTSILDAWLKWHPSENFSARLGRGKTGISRQFNTPISKIQFADRTFVSDRFSFGRRDGLALEVDFEGFSLGGAVFNPSDTTTPDTNHLWVLNARYSYGDINPFEEGDVNDTDHGVSVGLAYALSEDDASCDFCTGDDLEVWNADFSYTYSGFSLHAEYFNGDADSGGDEDGFYVQAGYFLIPSQLEFAARYQFVDADESFTDYDELTGWDFVVNYYWWKHQLKAQVGYSRQTRDFAAGGDSDDNRFIFQLASWF